MNLDAAFREHDTVLRDVARRLTSGGPADPDDAVQEVWLAALQHGIAHRSWLLTVLRNRVVDEVRRFARGLGGHERTPPYAIVRESELAPGTDDGRSGADVFDWKVAEAAARSTPPNRSVRFRYWLFTEGLPALTPTQRQAVEMWYLECLPVREIARRIGRPEHTVYTRLDRARRQLRKAAGLAQLHNEPPKRPGARQRPRVTGESGHTMT